MALREQSPACLHVHCLSNSGSISVFSPDGQCIASSNYSRKVTLWDAANGILLNTIEVNGIVCSIAFNSSGDLMAIGQWSSIIEIHVVSTTTRLLTLNGHSDGVRSVSFSSRDTLASTSWDATIRIWDVATGTCSHVLRGHSGVVNSVAYSSDGNRIVTSSSDKTVKTWDVATGTCLTTVDLGGPCHSATFSPDDHDIVAMSNNGMIRLNARTGKVLLQKDIKWFKTQNFVSSDGRLLVVSTFYTEVMLWNSRTGTCFAKFSGHNGKIFSIAISPSGDKLAIGSVNGITMFWDLSELLSEARVLALVLSGRRRRLPHIPQELWQLILDEFC